jgi:hypothetical protein
MAAHDYMVGHIAYVEPGGEVLRTHREPHHCSGLMRFGYGAETVWPVPRI